MTVGFQCINYEESSKSSHGPLYMYMHKLSLQLQSLPQARHSGNNSYNWDFNASSYTINDLTIHETLCYIYIHPPALFIPSS